jgi:hypothetical protein
VAVVALAGLYYFGMRIKDSAGGPLTTNVIFLQKIGAYTLVTADAGFSDESCSAIEEHRDTKNLGLTGEICERSMGAEYKDATSGHVVFVHFIRITKNSELYQKLLGRMSTPARLEPYAVIRLEGSEIGWFPKTGFDIVITQEGNLTPTGFDYSLKAAGTNAVTQYFINQYGPSIN